MVSALLMSATLYSAAACSEAACSPLRYGATYGGIILQQRHVLVSFILDGAVLLSGVVAALCRQQPVDSRVRELQQFAHQRALDGCAAVVDGCLDAGYVDCVPLCAISATVKLSNMPAFEPPGRCCYAMPWRLR
jgi:hypothetical protein